MRVRIEHESRTAASVAVNQRLNTMAARALSLVVHHSVAAASVRAVCAAENAVFLRKWKLNSHAEFFYTHHSNFTPALQTVVQLRK